MSSEVMTLSSWRVDALPVWTSVLAVVAHPTTSHSVSAPSLLPSPVRGPGSRCCA
jgi:hypothetical protein